MLVIGFGVSSHLLPSPCLIWFLSFVIGMGNVSDDGGVCERQWGSCELEENGLVVVSSRGFRNVIFISKYKKLVL